MHMPPLTQLAAPYRYVDCVFEQIASYFPEDMLEWSNLWSVFSPRSIPDPDSGKSAWSGLDKCLTALGELYGETGVTRKLTPPEMVGQKVEVYWHLDKKWYEATITDENPDGTFKVKYADQSKFQANRPVIAPEIDPYAGVISMRTHGKSHHTVYLQVACLTLS